jgi:hypothetical protein
MLEAHIEQLRKPAGVQEKAQFVVSQSQFDFHAEKVKKIMYLSTHDRVVPQTIQRPFR